MTDRYKQFVERVEQWLKTNGHDRNHKSCFARGIVTEARELLAEEPEERWYQHGDGSICYCVRNEHIAWSDRGGPFTWPREAVSLDDHKEIPAAKAHAQLRAWGWKVPGEENTEAGGMQCGDYDAAESPSGDTRQPLDTWPKWFYFRPAAGYLRLDRSTGCGVRFDENGEARVTAWTWGDVLANPGWWVPIPGQPACVTKRQTDPQSAHERHYQELIESMKG